jgi:hypothetical protein
MKPPSVVRPLLIVGLAVVLRALQELDGLVPGRVVGRQAASFIARRPYSRLMMSARPPSLVPP